MNGSGALYGSNGSLVECPRCSLKLISGKHADKYSIGTDISGILFGIKGCHEESSLWIRTNTGKIAPPVQMIFGNGLNPLML